jgi:hypothetical protein
MQSKPDFASRVSYPLHPLKVPPTESGGDLDIVSRPMAFGMKPS